MNNQILNIKTNEVLKGKYRNEGSVLVLLDATNGSFSLELPDCRGVRDLTFNFVRKDETANTVTLTTFSTQQIQNSDTKTVSDPVQLKTNLIDWWII